MTDFWQNRRVLITGHTGFKGAWTTFWLAEQGAKISGLALEPNTDPNLFTLLNLSQRGDFIYSDITDENAVRELIARNRPEIIIHMAAQALVTASYRDPVKTFATNSLGTAILLDAARQSPDTKAILIVTTDKVYDNLNLERGYHEEDRLGGKDPYSASKACAELIVSSYRRSFFQSGDCKIATVRAGNVIGGGDWAEGRIIPDIVRGCLAKDGMIKIRNRQAVRPWQHVHDVIRAYLMLAEQLFNQVPDMDTSWNIGPSDTQAVTVNDLAKHVVQALQRGKILYETNPDAPHEERYLTLDNSKAARLLNWLPLMSLDTSIELTANWYKAWMSGTDMVAYSRAELSGFRSRI